MTARARWRGSPPGWPHATATCWVFPYYPCRAAWSTSLSCTRRKVSRRRGWSRRSGRRVAGVSVSPRRMCTTSSTPPPPHCAWSPPRSAIRPPSPKRCGRCSRPTRRASTSVPPKTATTPATRSCSTPARHWSPGEAGRRSPRWSWPARPRSTRSSAPRRCGPTRRPRCSPPMVPGWSCAGAHQTTPRRWPGCTRGARRRRSSPGTTPACARSPAACCIVCSPRRAAAPCSRCAAPTSSGWLSSSAPRAPTRRRSRCWWRTSGRAGVWAPP